MDKGTCSELYPRTGGVLVHLGVLALGFERVRRAAVHLMVGWSGKVSGKDLYVCCNTRAKQKSLCMGVPLLGGVLAAAPGLCAEPDMPDIIRLRL